MEAIRTMIRTDLAPIVREVGKKLLIAGVAALGAKFAAGSPLLALAAGLAAVLFAMACEHLWGNESAFAAVPSP